MSAFMRSLLGAMGEGKDAFDSDDATEVFDHAVRTSRALAKSLIKQSQQYTDNYYKAALFLFVTVWALVGLMYRGVEESSKNHGKTSMVPKLWHLLRIGFSTGGGDSAKGLARIMAKLDTFEEDFEGGKFNDVH